jgi:uncharacterized protein YbcI
MIGEAGERGRQAAAISNAITRIHRENYGRGGTTVRTIMHRNYIVTFLEDIYTPIERTLIDAGHPEQVRETRQIFQDAMRDRFARAAEEATGRRVVAFMSQVHFDPDLACEVFVLEPRVGEAEPEEAPQAG